MTYAVKGVYPYSLKKNFGAYASLAAAEAVGALQYTSPGSLVAWWRLNTNVSSTGNVDDSSDNERPGTFDALGDRPAYSTVLYPSSRIQDASNTFDNTSYTAINVGTAATWNSIIGNGTGGTSKMTFSAWVYKTGDGGATEGRILDFGGADSTSTDLAIWTDSTERIYFRADMEDAPSYYFEWYAPAAQFSLNTWTHIVITYDASTEALAHGGPTIYVNGVDVGTLTRSGSADGTWTGIIGEDCYVGNRSGTSGSRGFKGNMADVAVWNKILTATEVKAIYDASQYDLYGAAYRNWKVRGSVASNTGSVDQFRQGINVNENKYMLAGLTPKLGPGSRYNIFFNGVNVSSGSVFNDMIAIDAGTTGSVKQIGTYDVPGNAALNGNPIFTRKNAVRFESTLKRTEEPNFQIEQQNFGQAKAFKDDTPFEEMQRFDAKQYLTDDTGAMVYPYVGLNPGAMDPYQMDGIIEPMPIRDAISLNTPSFPFFARGVWGTLESNYAQDSNRTSILITQQINNVSSSFPPFEDGFEYFMGHNTIANLLSASFSGSQLSDPPFMPIVFPPTPGYISEITSSVTPWKDEITSGYYATQLSGNEMVEAVTAMTGAEVSTSGMPPPILINNVGRNIGVHGGGQLLKRNHRSATSGFIYDNNNKAGTDSIAFGGWKK